jgi:hypothetical protein
VGLWRLRGRAYLVEADAGLIVIDTGDTKHEGGHPYSLLTEEVVPINVNIEEVAWT